MYIKKLYSQDPLFENVKVIYSMFENTFKGVLSNDIVDKLLFENLDKKDVARIKKPNIGNLHKFAIDYSDAIIQASPNINNSIIEYAKSSGKEFLEYPGAEDYIHAYEELYNKILDKKKQAVEAALIDN
jgi:starch synthase